MDSQVITKAQAVAGGMKSYFTGKLCKRGHRSHRRTVSHACLECARIASRAWSKANPEKVRLSTRERHRRLPGVGLPTRQCPAACEICGHTDSDRVLSLDHCHSTGNFRGWLCNNCNRGIGLLGDTLADLDAAAAYLRRAETILQ